MFDREVGDAAGRIEFVGRGEGVGGADVEAAVAGAAMVGFAVVTGQVEIGQDGTEEQPRAEVAGNQIGVLALPAQPCHLRQRFFEQGSRVDEHLDLCLRGTRDELRGQRFQPALDDVVIIPVAGIDGDGAFLPPFQRVEWIGFRAVIHRQHDRARRLRPHGTRVTAAGLRFFQPTHGGVVASAECRRQTLCGKGDVSLHIGKAHDADGVETESRRFIADMVLKATQKSRST